MSPYITQKELDANKSLFCTCPRCEREGFAKDDMVKYYAKGWSPDYKQFDELCEECFIEMKQEVIGTLELVVGRDSWAGWTCTRKEWDLGVSVGSGSTIQAAIDSFLELEIEMKHDIDPKHISYTWTGTPSFTLTKKAA